MTCACGRPASHVRWGYSLAVEARRGSGVTYRGARVPCCAFHYCWPDDPHPFDLHDVDWPKAVDA